MVSEMSDYVSGFFPRHSFYTFSKIRRLWWKLQVGLYFLLGVREKNEGVVMFYKRYLNISQHLTFGFLRYLPVFTSIALVIKITIICWYYRIFFKCNTQ